MSVLIQGGRIVTASEDFTGDLLIDGEKVVAWGTRLDVRADLTLDARDKLVFPGGIDPHTHLEMGIGRGISTSDDFDSGSEAALCGGTTTLIDFANQVPGASMFDAFFEWKSRAKHSNCDVGAHVTITDLPPERIPELDALFAEGVSSYKMFMAYPGRLYTDDRTRFRAYREVARRGGILLMHAESGLVIDELVSEAVAAGHTEAVWHARTRPPELGAEAIHRSAVLAKMTGVPLYIVHMNCAQGVEVLRQARADGVEIYGEVCPQYLYMDESRLEGPEGARYLCSPPLRPVGHPEALWRAMLQGEFSTVATDHCPFDSRHREAALDFRQVPNGLGGVEERMRYLFSEGVVKRGLSLREFVALTSTRAAQLFGLWPRKGTLAPGADADVVVWDPAQTATLSASNPRLHHSKSDYSCYEGLEVTGGPELVLLRGEVVVREGALVSRGRGRYLSRGPAGKPLK